MMEGKHGFPSFDDSQRPSVDEHGRQHAPETFVRWLEPAIWLDTAGGVHLDIRCFHEWLGWPMTPESIRETAQMMVALLEEARRKDPENYPAALIVRP